MDGWSEIWPSSRLVDERSITSSAARPSCRVRGADETYTSLRRCGNQVCGCGAGNDGRSALTLFVTCRWLVSISRLIDAGWGDLFVGWGSSGCWKEFPRIGHRKALGYKGSLDVSVTWFVTRLTFVGGIRFHAQWSWDCRGYLVCCNLCRCGALRSRGSFGVSSCGDRAWICRLSWVLASFARARYLFSLWDTRLPYSEA